MINPSELNLLALLNAAMNSPHPQPFISRFSNANLCDRFLAYEKLCCLWQVGLEEVVREIVGLRRDWGFRLGLNSKTLTFDDENPVPALRKLQVDYPNATIYLSGAIAVDVPEDLELGSQNPSALQTLSVARGSVTMNYHPLGVAIVQLADQYVTGMVGVKMISGRL